MKQTLSEKLIHYTTMFLVGVMFLGFMFICIVQALYGTTDGTSQSEFSFGVNGFVETRCIGGVKVVVGQNSFVTQVLDENGKGVKCGK